MSKTLYRRRKDSGKRLLNQSSSRQQIAYQAAKLLVGGQAQDYDSAKHKAAKQLGMKIDGPLPSDVEIQENLAAYQKLFHKDQHLERLVQLRQLAQKAMQLFDRFAPRLVGPVLTGLVTQSTPVNLLVFADPVENINIFLLEKRIPFDSGLETITLPDGSNMQMATYRINEHGESVEIMALPPEMRKNLPTYAKGHTLIYRGIGVKALQKLLEDENKTAAST